MDIIISNSSGVPIRETRREAVLCQIEEHLSQAVDAARAGAVDLDELTEMLNTLYNEGEL